jgi:myo-inositol-1(or 4)-monophosphatase
VDHTELQTLLIPAVAAAQAAGELLADYFRRIDASQIDSKSSAVDLVSIADREAEALLREYLARAMPSAGFIGEESAPPAPGTFETTWVVDPLDGTSNYLAGLPIWAVSIALCDHHLLPQLGVVHAPLLGRTWTTVRGGGAWCAGQRLAVRQTPPGGGLANAMLATGFPYDIAGQRGLANISYFCHMQRVFHKIRRLGSAAIDLAYVAEGTFDGMWELSLSAWDTAAGMLLITEAGGLVQRLDGSAYTPGDSAVLAAATPELAEAMRLNLRSAQGCPLTTGLID